MITETTKLQYYILYARIVVIGVICLKTFEVIFV